MRRWADRLKACRVIIVRIMLYTNLLWISITNLHLINDSMKLWYRSNIIVTALDPVGPHCIHVTLHRRREKEQTIRTARQCWGKWNVIYRRICNAIQFDSTYLLILTFWSVILIGVTGDCASASFVSPSMICIMDSISNRNGSGLKLFDKNLWCSVFE